jgi:hypothetical protein
MPGEPNDQLKWGVDASFTPVARISEHFDSRDFLPYNATKITIS